MSEPSEPSVPPHGRVQSAAGYLSQFRSAALDAVTVFLIVAVVGALVSIVVAAGRERGLVIESFSVPPDAAQRGLTGQVLASQLLDRITYMQSRSTIPASATSLQVSPPDIPLKVQVSSATITLDAVYTYLRAWLGSETFVTGELVESDGPRRMLLTARAGGVACSASGTGLDTMLAAVAGCIYRNAQPYRYAAFIAGQGRTADAAAIYRQVIRAGRPAERAWAYEALGYRIQTGGAPVSDPAAGTGLRARYVEAIADYRAAIDGTGGVPGLKTFVLAWRDLADAEDALGHDEESYRAIAEILQLTRGATSDVTAATASALRREYAARVDDDLGDYLDAAALRTAMAKEATDADERDTALSDYAEDLANLHDGAAVARLGSLDDGSKLEIDVLLGRWNEAVQAGAGARTQCASDCLDGATVAPFIAQALARLDAQNHRGFADALAALGPPLDDCYICVRTRALIAALKGDRARTDLLYAQAIARAPDLPIAYSEYGQALLGQGRLAQAIDQFARANARGPRFADPLEGWGEALIATGRCDLALAKFEEAARYAPRWGRLHLKWGEALLWSGDKAGARKEFDRAAGLDLSAPDRAILARLRA